MFQQVGVLQESEEEISLAGQELFQILKISWPDRDLVRMGGEYLFCMFGGKLAPYIWPAEVISKVVGFRIPA